MGKQTAVDLEDRIAKLVADEVLRNYKVYFIFYTIVLKKILKFIIIFLISNHYY